MKGQLAIIIAVVVVAILGVGAFVVLGKKGMSTTSTKTTVEPTKSAGVFSSIQDALSRSISLECDYSTPNGVSVKAFIKNGQVRSDVTGKTAQENGSAIIKDKKMYFWNGQTAIVMDMPDISVTPSAGESSNQGESTLSSLEQYKQYCHAASVSDSEFVLPTGVKFQNISSMMPSGMPTRGKVMPSGAVVPSNYQQMMQQYQNYQNK